MRIAAVIVMLACLLAFATIAFALEETPQSQEGDAQTTVTSTAGQDVQQAEQETMAGESTDGEEQAGFGYEYSGTIASGYLWRGLLLTDGPVFQPSFTISQDELSLNLWGNMDLDNVNGLGGELSEVDLTLDYTREIGDCSFSTGVGYYGYPHTGIAGTNEAYVSISLDKHLSPTVTVWRDFGETDGTYCALELSHSFICNSERTLDLSTGVGWGNSKNNAACFGVPSSALTDFYLGAGMQFDAGCGLSITPSVTYSRILDGALRKAAADDDVLVFAVEFTYGL